MWCGSGRIGVSDWLWHSYVVRNLYLSDLIDVLLLLVYIRESTTRSVSRDRDQLETIKRYTAFYYYYWITIQYRKASTTLRVSDGGAYGIWTCALPAAPLQTDRDRAGAHFNWILENRHQSHNLFLCSIPWMPGNLTGLGTAQRSLDEVSQH